MVVRCLQNSFKNSKRIRKPVSEIRWPLFHFKNYSGVCLKGKCTKNGCAQHVDYVKNYSRFGFNDLWRRDFGNDFINALFNWDFFYLFILLKTKPKNVYNSSKQKFQQEKCIKIKKNNLQRIFLRSLNEKKINPPTLSTYWCRTEIENSVK